MMKSIEISDELYTKIADHCKKSGQSISSFVEQSVTHTLTDAPVYQPHDEAEMKERLKSLGYID